jgi:hypothetical protein
VHMQKADFDFVSGACSNSNSKQSRGSICQGASRRCYMCCALAPPLMPACPHCSRNFCLHRSHKHAHCYKFHSYWLQARIVCLLLQLCCRYLLQALRAAPPAAVTRLSPEASATVYHHICAVRVICTVAMLQASRYPACSAASSSSSLEPRGLSPPPPAWPVAGCSSTRSSRSVGARGAG